MLTWEFQRLSMPAGDGAAEHQQRHPRPVGELHPVGGVFEVRGGNVIVEAAPVVPGQQEHGGVPQAGGDDRGDGLPDGVVAESRRRRGCSSSGLSCQIIDRAGSVASGGVGRDLVAAHDVRRPVKLLVERDRVAARAGIGLPGQAVVGAWPGSEGMSQTGSGASRGGLRNVGDWPPTISRWLGVELVPNPEQWFSRNAPVAAR